MALLKKLNTSSENRKQIKSWLKAGVLEGLDLSPIEMGTPQGGAISPLLANIALHGMENHIIRLAQNIGIYQGIKVIRYADDLVIIHSDRLVVMWCMKALESWLSKMGLELKPSKTRIVHTYRKYGGEVGFDFLGFNVRHYQVAKRLQWKDLHGKTMEHRTLIKPRRKAIERHYKQLSEKVYLYRTKGQVELIRKLNPVINGWSNYYSRVVSKEVFSKLDHLLWKKLWSWAKRRHPKKRLKWIAKKYWRIERGKGKGKGTFAARSGDRTELSSHADMAITRHTKVKGSKSPFDGDWVYWVKRKTSFPGVSTLEAELLKQQKGKCAECKMMFTSEDIVEVDHIIPRSQGGNDRRSNKQLLHGHCHDQKTARDMQEHKSEEEVKPMAVRKNRRQPHGLVYTPRPPESVEEFNDIDKQIIRLERWRRGETVDGMGPFPSNDEGLRHMTRMFRNRHHITDRHITQVMKLYDASLGNTAE